jgi:hypothetical protein
MCQSEPRGVPGLAQGAGVDAGQGICPGGSKSRPIMKIIRPGPGEHHPGPAGIVNRSGPAGILYLGPTGIRRGRPGRESRPSRILLIRPSRGVAEKACQGAGGGSPAGLGCAGPAGWRRPARGRGGAAQPGHWTPAQPGYRGRPGHAGLKAQPGHLPAQPGCWSGAGWRPIRGRSAGPPGLNCYAGPAFIIPAWTPECRPSCAICRPGKLYSGPGDYIPAQGCWLSVFNIPAYIT